MRVTKAYKERLRAAKEKVETYAKRRVEDHVPCADLAAEAGIGTQSMVRLLAAAGVDFAALRKAESVSVRRTGAKKSPNQRHPRRARSFEDMAQEARLDHD